MAERAAHLIDHVFPDVPVRQWVLSLPYRMRYQLAWDHELCRAVVGVFVRAVLGFLRARARDNGVADGRGGAVAVIQRFGGALNLNVHVRWRRRLYRESWRSDLIEALAFVVWATRPSRSRRPRPEAVTHGRTALICMRVLSYRLGNGSGSSACVATGCVHL